MRSLRLTALLQKQRLTALAQRTAALAVIAGVLTVASCTGLMAPVDEGLAAARFELLPRAPGETLTTVEVDEASLKAAGAWPIPRERLAQALLNLQNAGAETIGFDMALPSEGTPQASGQLEAVIARRPDAIVLPTFTSLSAAAGLLPPTPLGKLAGEAVLASPDLIADPDGMVRRYPLSRGQGAAERPSLAAVLADAPAAAGERFLIDYAIRGGGIDRLSFEAVYRGRFDPALVQGRSILVGATVPELANISQTPTAGPLPRLFVHALAYESLEAGRALRTLPAEAMLAMALAFALLLQPPWKGRELKKVVAAHVLLAVCALSLPAVLQGFLPITLHTGIILLAAGLSMTWGLWAELSRRAAMRAADRMARLERQAVQTLETELPNPRALTEELGLRLGRKGPPATVVVALGLDRFSVMRRAIGYGPSNQVMQALAKRIAHVTGEAQVAQLSTSVLGVAVSGESAEALKLKVRALEMVDPTFRLLQHTVEASTRLGLAYGAPEVDKAEALIERAVMALDEARRQDRRCLTFEAKAFGDPSRNLALMSEMRHGLRSGELELHYQPKLALADGAIASAEALVRWAHPDRGPIGPADFVRTAEETGNIRLLTEWVLEAALADQAELAETGQDLRLAINVSGRLLGDRDFRRRLLRKAGGRKLMLEISEAAVVENPRMAASAIAAFREAGLKISIDNYGAGLSSLNHLKRLHAHELKLDRALSGSVTEDRRDRMVVKSAIDLAHSLGMAVVAEGVEDEAVRRALARLGCDMVQGFVAARPMPVDELRAFVARRRPRMRQAQR